MFVLEESLRLSVLVVIRTCVRGLRIFCAASVEERLRASLFIAMRCVHGRLFRPLAESLHLSLGSSLFMEQPVWFCFVPSATVRIEADKALTTRISLAPLIVNALGMRWYGMSCALSHQRKIGTLSLKA